MRQILTDLGYAISDLGLELSLTGLLLIILLIGGYIVGKRSQSSRLRSSKRPMNYKIRLRTQREQHSSKTNWWNDFWQGISTELLGAVITTFAFGVVLLVFQQYSAIQNRQDELILQMGSPDNAFAIEAIRQLSVLGWLSDGTLNNENLSRADLTDADLESANLVNSDLSRTDLTNANLMNANLTNANLEFTILIDADLGSANLMNSDLSRTDLTNANLTNANLRNADLRSANLTNADLLLVDLTNANLQSANLTNADLSSANLSGVVFSEDTTLPDGTNWTPDTDMSQFTLNGILTNANLRERNLRNANLQNFDFTNTSLVISTLINADLRSAILINTTFNSRTILPDGTNWTSDTDMERFTNPLHPEFWDICIEGNPIPSYCE